MKTFETIPTLKQFNTFKECLLQNIFLKKKKNFINLHTSS